VVAVPIAGRLGKNAAAILAPALLIILPIPELRAEVGPAVVGRITVASPPPVSNPIVLSFTIYEALNMGVVRDIVTSPTSDPAPIPA
jgi:hypothetical protein